MSAVSGLAELVRELRGLAHFRGTPIVMLTTGAHPSLKEAGRLAGANAWIVKPFDPDTLLAIVERFLAAPPAAGLEW